MPEDPVPTPHKRRPRYSGKNPRRFEDKYKEHSGDSATLEKVRASGKTPAGSHVPILLPEILEVLSPAPGKRAVDCTLGHGGHAQALLTAGAELLGLDADPIEIQRTEERLRLAVPGAALETRRMNYAGIRSALAEVGWADGVDLILADLGCSSMQFDNPTRGFSFKHKGPLDMRMNPQRGSSAREWLAKLSAAKLEPILRDHSDEPHAKLLAPHLAGADFPFTTSLAEAIRKVLPHKLSEEDRDSCVRRVFQALRILVNDEFTALDTYLAQLPHCLRPGGKVAILTFHSGEDRRVKHAFRDGLACGDYSEVSDEVIRPSLQELRDNPRSAPAKLRWAMR
jgi:16S rRNA (cytosine1402-N4)-methyltransferase